jgi:PAS domain S-box-containing protein
MSVPQLPAARRPSVQTRGLRIFLVCCGLAAIGLSAVAQIAQPAHGNVLISWLVTVVVPGAIVVLVISNRRDSVPVLVLVCALIDVEAVLLASLYVIGIAFAIVLPIIGIGLVQPYLGGWAKMAAYIAAVVVSTTSVALAELGIPPNHLGADQPMLAIAAFGLVSAFALGLTWFAGVRLTLALEAAGREIEARISAEKRLSRTAQTLGRMISSSPVATIALDADGVVTVWNPAAERLFGWAPDEVVGRRLPLPGGDGAAAELRWRIERALVGEALQGEVARGETRDGRRVLVELHTAILYDDRARPRGRIVQVIDVTQRSALEAQLRQAQKMEAVGQLAGGIAHDINNTLTAVGGFAELIEEGAEDPELQEYARTISSAVVRGGDLTRQLLAFARRSVLQPRSIDVSRFLASILPMLQRLLGSDVAVVVRTDAEDAAINVDPGQFEQAMLNLAVNARDAMPSGGTLSIATSRVAPADPAPGAGGPAEIVVTVADTGVGIPSDLQDLVFEPFFTTKQKGKGTGLGLAMVYGFVTQSGGKVSLRSVPGEGTTVEIRLPEALDVPVAVPRAAAAASSRGTETVLLVEDEAPIALFGRKVLTSLGYRVLDARDGMGAVEIARSYPEPIELIVSDVIMPGMVGPEVVRAVRDLHPEAAVLYASGYTADAIADRGVLPKGVELVLKPYTAGEFAARVRAALDARAVVAGRARSPVEG